MSKIAKKLLGHIGINPDRFRLEWVSAGEGIRFAEIMNAFSQTTRELGPLGSSEGIDKAQLTFNLEAALKLVPFIKLVERERLRVPIRTEVEYEKFFASGDLDRLFDEIILEKYAISQIVALLQKKPLSTSEIAESLNLNPSEVSRHINNSSRYGFVRYDVEQQCYAPA